MSQKTIILSICLPTINQPERVRAFLECVGKQMRPEVEIVIRDDSPGNETKQIVEKEISRFPGTLRYYKGEKAKQGGYDMALLFLTKEAGGKYVWWFGDDVMAPDAVKRVLRCVTEDPETSFVWVNSRSVYDKRDVALDLGGDRVFRDSNEIVAINIGLLGFPSMTIIKKEVAESGMGGAEECIGTTLSGLYLVLHVITKGGGRLRFLQEPCVWSNPKPSGEARWYDSFEVHGINYSKVALRFKKFLKKRVLRGAMRAQFRKAWKAVVVERALGHETGFASKSPKINKAFRLYWNFLEFWIALPFLLLPRRVVRLGYRAHKGARTFPRRLFRKAFPEKTMSDFPGGYTQNRYILDTIDRGPVLVIGDYEGRDYPDIKKKCEETYLVDVVDNGIAEPEWFRRQSVTEPLPFPDNYFKYAVMTEVLEHVWEDKKTLEEIRRTLAPDGKLLLSVPLYQDFPDHHYHVYSPKTLHILLRHSGFSVLFSDYRGIIVAIPNHLVALLALALYPAYGKQALRKTNEWLYGAHRALRRARRLNSICRFKIPFLWGYGVMITAEKSTEERVDDIEIQRRDFTKQKHG